MNPDLILEKTIQLNLSSDVVTKRKVGAITRSRLPSSRPGPILLASALCALTATLGHAELLDPTAFTSLGPSPFVSGTYEVDTSFDNPAPSIKQGTSVIATGIFYDPTPTNTTNRDEIAVFTFDTIDLPAGVTLAGVRNANSRPAALLSKDSITVGGLIDFSGAPGVTHWWDKGGDGGAAGPGGGGGGGGGGADPASQFGRPGSGGVGFVSGYPGEYGVSYGGDGGAGGSVEPGGGGLGSSSDFSLSGGGGGGAFGGNGGTREGGAAGGTAYGDLTAKLEAGSGGGGSRYAVSGGGGGGGGGAVELGAVSTLSLHGRLTTQGGAGGVGGAGGDFGAGGGAGGGVIFHANSVVLDSGGSIDASGGSAVFHGSGGGGGRVLLVANTITTADLSSAVNVTGGAGGDSGANPGSNGVVSSTLIPQITCPPSTSISCAPAGGLPVTLSVSVSDPDPSQTLRLTLKEGSSVLDTKSAATPVTNLLVTFDSVMLSATGHALTVEVDDGTAMTSCTTSVTVDADTSSPTPNLSILPTITGQCSASVSTVPTATDSCAGRISGTTTDPRSYSTQGTFTIHWTYDDGHGNTTIQTQTVIVQDTLAPTITACPPNQSANATSPTGAMVNYPAATASDDNCAPPTLSYSQAAGTLFPLGDTMVTVTATDATGHQVTRTFNIHVKGATEQLSDLIVYVAALSIDSATKVSLQAKLTAAKSALAAGNRQGAMTALQDFINATSAVKGKKLSAAQASRLISDATRIRAVIGG